MEFLKANYIETTTSIVVGSNTITAENLLDRDLSFQYYTSGFNNDATTASIRINFDSTMTVSRIAIMGHNLKSFTIYYNGATANTFALTSTGSTITSDFATNSETSQYFTCTPVACTSVSIDMKTTMVANSEKAIGYLVISQEYVDFPRIPSAKNYKPVIDVKDVRHELSDGTFRIQAIKENRSATIKLTNIEESFRDSLKTVYDVHGNFIFAAFPTTTGWDEFMFPCIWDGPFEFYHFSENAPDAGFDGTIRLLETSL